MSFRGWSPDHGCFCFLELGHTKELPGISNVTFPTCGCFPACLSRERRGGSSSWLLGISVRGWQRAQSQRSPRPLGLLPPSHPFGSAFGVSLSVARDPPRHLGRDGGICSGCFKPGAALACAVACARASVGISGFLRFSLIILLRCCPDEDLFQRDKFADDV